VWIIIVADVTMSLDNVLAIAGAARGDMLLVGVGIASSLPFVVWGSGLLASLMNRHVWIIWLGGGILGYVAAEMILDDPALSTRFGPLVHALQYAAPVGLGAIVTALGWWLTCRHGRPRPGGKPMDKAVGRHLSGKRSTRRRS
jgi:predicted tellurium resistance membrane protein TerC